MHKTSANVKNNKIQNIKENDLSLFKETAEKHVFYDVIFFVLCVFAPKTFSRVCKWIFVLKR